MELTTLSWMLLAADRAESQAVFLSLFFVISLIFTIARGLTVVLDDDYKKFKVLPMWCVVLIIGWGVPMVLVALVPSATVIMQVAAIELGDDVLNSDEFKRILEIYIPKKD